MPLKLYEKENILESFLEIFVQNGYTKTTTAMLAEAAGISKALLFHHFKSKKMTYISILDRCFEKMSVEIKEDPLANYDNYFEAKGQINFNKIEYMKKNPDVSKILYEAFHSTPEELKEEIFKFTIHIKNKYGSIEEAEGRLMKKLFDEIPLREGVKNEQAYELVNVVMAYFRKRIALDLKDDEKLLNDEYWDVLLEKKRNFLDMIRYGIEQKGR